MHIKIILIYQNITHLYEMRIPYFTMRNGYEYIRIWPQSKRRTYIRVPGKQPGVGGLWRRHNRPRTTYYTYHDEEYAQVPLNALTSPCWHPFPPSSPAKSCVRASGQHMRLLAIVSGSSYSSRQLLAAPADLRLLRSFVNNAVVGKQIARAYKYSNNISARTSNKVKQTRALSAWMLFSFFFFFFSPPNQATPARMLQLQQLH